MNSLAARLRLHRTARELTRAQAFQERMPDLIVDLITDIEARFDRLETTELEGDDGPVVVADFEQVEDLRDWLIDELLELSGRKASLK
jgi:hypothetical protein